MNAALLLTLALSPVHAADKPAAPAPVATAPTAAPDASPNVPAKDQMPNPGSDGGVTPYGLKDLDEVLKADLKLMEADYKEAMKTLDAQYEAQKELETRQLKDKFEFLKKLRDARAAFERQQIEDWKKFAEKLKTIEPAERGTEKQMFDQKAMEARHKLDDDGVAKNKEFMEKQQAERDAFWAKRQQENNERSKMQQEHATKWGKPSPAK